MRYGSVCSGIEAATVAWHPLGWEPAFFSEIEKFPNAILAHHYPSVPNFGDMTKFKEWPSVSIDLLVGGTPCQSFSVAGLRKGLDDPRGNLALVFLAVLDRLRPQWVVWENVPGVLSNHEGRDFASFLGGLGKLGYGWAYRMLDAQYFGVPQRRRRPFVVGHLGDWRRAAAVLLERQGLQWNPPPSREAGERVAGSLASRASAGGGLGTDLDCDGGLIAHVADVAPTLNAHFGDKQGLENQHIDSGAGLFVAHAHKGEGHDASEDGTGRGTPITISLASDPISAKDVAMPITSRNGDPGVVAFQETESGTHESGLVGSLRANGPGHDPVGTRVRTGMRVRRLTPMECERLQGFPDDYTLTPYRKKMAADEPRYKALGNSMAVPVMRWIGERIDKVRTI